MRPSSLATYENIFSTCRRTLGIHIWGRVLAALDEDLTAESFPDTLATLSTSMGLPGYLVDLARVEWLLHQKQVTAEEPVRQARTISPNPTLTIVPVLWKHLATFVRSNAAGTPPLNEPAYVRTRRRSAAAPVTAAAPPSISWRCCPMARCTPAGSFLR